MPDTMIPQTDAPAVAPASCGVLSDYRSLLIGQLVAARARASADIKRVVKDKQAKVESRKEGGRSYSYAFADLFDVMDAVSDALAAQELALFQTLQERRGMLVLVTTLAHSSDQWVASEVRVGSHDAGPQVFGSAMTYMRRYSALGILGIAPDSDADDDGKAAQTRADQQARQKPRHRAEQSSCTNPPPQAQKPAQHVPAVVEPGAYEPDEPRHMPVVNNNLSLWASDAWDALCDRPLGWRQAWLALHAAELERVRGRNENWARNIEDLANEPDVAASE